MRTFAQNQKPTQQAAHTAPSTHGLTNSAQVQTVGSVRQLRSAFDNQAEQRLPGGAADGLEVSSSLNATPRFAHDFSHIPAYDQASVKIQTKLRVNTPGDVFEQEADHVADRVMRMTEPRKNGPSCACDGECPKCQAKTTAQAQRLVQTKSVQTNEAREAAPSSVEETLHEPGQPLDAGIREFMEPRFGHDFSRVRVHADPIAAGSAESIGARAYTVGHHVVFGAGEYRPQTADGRRLLAHELAHVAQQDAWTSLRGAVAQREDKAPAKTPAKNTAAGGPKLDFQPTKNPPPCACLVFIHHNEPNARLVAQLMFEFCHYNLAIIDPQTSARQIDLPGKGLIDPNELFPRNVAEECWDDDKPCEDFMTKNAGATGGKLVEEFAQRQFFLAIKKCSKGFSLPVIALHNNTIDETAKYREAVRDPAAPLDLSPIRGKTFDDSLKSGDKSPDVNTVPFTDLQEWMLKNVPGVGKKKTPTGTKGTLTGGPIAPGKTNIFLWCSAADISRCQIGDPERPDNVVWVTNAADFEKLRGTKTNVVLQTRVDPAGRSATDLSSLFVFLEEIVGKRFSDLIIKLESDVAVDATAIIDSIAELRKLYKYDDLTLSNALDEFFKILMRVIDLLIKLVMVASAHGTRAIKLSQLRFINIETPQTPTDSTMTKEDLRVKGFRDVKATLGPLGLDCCDATPAKGETESAVDKVEKSLREGKLPKDQPKKTK